MDFQIYYNKIRDIEQSLTEPSVVLVSHDTPDGGREGVRTEVSRRIAAKMIVEGCARLATTEEVREFQAQKAEAKRRADQQAAASRMQFAILSPSEQPKLKGAPRPAAE